MTPLDGVFGRPTLPYDALSDDSIWLGSSSGEEMKNDVEIMTTLMMEAGSFHLRASDGKTYKCLHRAQLGYTVFVLGSSCCGWLAICETGHLLLEYSISLCIAQ